MAETKTKAPPPGSAAAANNNAPGLQAPPQALPPAAPTQPVTERMTAAQQEHADNLARQAAEQKRETTKPTIGRIVHYIAPDRRPRCARIVRVWDRGEDDPPNVQDPRDDANLFVNLMVDAEDSSDPHLARQTALQPAGPFQYLAVQVPFRGKDPAQIHCWIWPPRA